MKKYFACLAAGLLVSGVAGSAHSELLDRGVGTSVYGTYKLIYDTDLNITWYDFHYSEWQPYAAQWASGLAVNMTMNVGGVISTVTYNDWRLPTALNSDGTGPCQGDNCTDSEMGHLYYDELKNSGTGLINTGPFLNLRSDFYWSEEIYKPVMASAWGFDFRNGNQVWSSTTWLSSAIAVRGGDIATVPEPTSILLIGSGLAGLVGLKRRKK